MLVNIEDNIDVWSNSLPDAEEVDNRYITLYSFLKDHKTHPLVIAKVLLKHFGVDWIYWEPETIWAEVRREFATYPSALGKNKIQAVKAVLLAETFGTQWEIFNPTILALTNNIPIFGMHRPLTVAQLYAGIDIASVIRKAELGDEVVSYIAGCFLKEAVYYCPPPLEAAQTQVSKPMYYCPDCGYTKDDDMDAVCCVCSFRMKGENLGFKIPLDRLAHIKKTGEGTRIKRYLQHPYEDVKKRYEEIKNTKEKLEENAVDLQVGILIMAKNFVQSRREEAAKQLRSLGL